MHKINNLTLKDFRCYEHLDVAFNDGMNLIIGDNAQGKTSLLEAIYVLALSKSHKTSFDQVLIKDDAAFSKIQGKASLDNRLSTLEVILSKEGKKARYNHVEYKRLSDYIGLMNVIMFAPEDLNIIKGSPKERRRFLDLEMTQYNRHFLHHMTQYNKVLKERNEHLKALQKKRSKDYVLLDVLTDQLIHYGKKVMDAREAFVNDLNGPLKRLYKNLSGEDHLVMRYMPSVEGDIELAYKNKQTLDVLSGTTTLGPHRDDLSFYYGDTPVKKVASQGQIRSVALSLKLGVIDLIEANHQTIPIILLDDVFSELDLKRQKNILAHINKNAQVFITTTSLVSMNLKGLDRYTVYTIEQGTIKGVDNHGS